MLTTEFLRNWGANVDEGLARCLNNESFYLMLVGKSLQDANFSKLKEAVAAGELDKAFESAHALKGTMANLALTPILKPVQEITEMLRAGVAADYAPYLNEIEARRSELL